MDAKVIKCVFTLFTLISLSHNKATITYETSNSIKFKLQRNPNIGIANVAVLKTSTSKAPIRSYVELPNPDRFTTAAKTTGRKFSVTKGISSVTKGISRITKGISSVTKGISNVTEGSCTTKEDTNTNVIKFILKTTTNEFIDTRKFANTMAKSRMFKTKTTLRSPCHHGFIWLGTHCYYFSKAKATWYNAAKSCHVQDSDLAFPMNEREDFYLASFLTKKTGPKEKVNFWIGGHEEKQGEWRWHHNEDSIKFSKWADHQPDNAYGHEHCLQISVSAGCKWNDFNCEIPSRFICQQRHLNNSTK